MTELLDMVVVGAGPAGLAAAVNARIRGKSLMLISGDPKNSNLYKAQKVENYLGFGSVSGAALLERFLAHAEEMGVRPVQGRVLSILPMDKQFMVAYDDKICTARCVILAGGVVRTDVFPGETELLGRGVSYCATCDGMLYRGKEICVIGLNAEAEKEADYLREIGCRVRYIPREQAVKVKILGENSVSAVEVNGERFACSGVFILRDSVSPTSFLPSLELENGHIRVDERLQTSIPGIFAAGDCTGGPYQINKAVGEGQKAALNAVDDWLQNGKENV